MLPSQRVLCHQTVLFKDRLAKVTPLRHLSCQCLISCVSAPACCRPSSPPPRSAGETGLTNRLVHKGFHLFPLCGFAVFWHTHRDTDTQSSTKVGSFVADG